MTLVWGRTRAQRVGQGRDEAAPAAGPSRALRGFCRQCPGPGARRGPQGQRHSGQGLAAPGHSPRPSPGAPPGKRGSCPTTGVWECGRAACSWSCFPTALAQNARYLRLISIAQHLCARLLTAVVCRRVPIGTHRL